MSRGNNSSFDLSALGGLPTSNRSRKETAQRHGRHSSNAPGALPLASPASKLQTGPISPVSPSTPPKPTSPQKNLFSIPDSSPPPTVTSVDDPFAVFDPLASKPLRPAVQSSSPPAQPPSSVPAAASSLDPFANFFNSSSVASSSSSSSSSSASSGAVLSPPKRASNIDKSPKNKNKNLKKAGGEEDDDEDEESDDASESESEEEDDEEEENVKEKKQQKAKEKEHQGERSEEEEEDDDDDDQQEGKKKLQKKGTATKNEKLDKKGKKKEKNEAAAAAAVASITNSHQQHKRGPPLLKVDVLAYMKKGTPFLKYGNHGYPHFRQFQLSEDNTNIVWFSQAKKIKDTQIEIADIYEIRLGQTTPNFQKHKAPELSRSSFSIIYGGGRKTLDVIAKDPNEFKIWTEGLKELVKRNKFRAGELESLKSLVLEIGVHPGRRSSTEIVDVTTGLNADVLAPPTIPEEGAGRPRALSSGNKQMYKDVSKNFSELKRKLNKRKEELREEQFYSHPQYENMQVIVKRVQESINKINEWFQDGEYPLCDDEIWRASVDLESLKNMMKAVKTQ